MYSAKITDHLLNHNVSVFGKGKFFANGIEKILVLVYQYKLK